MMSEPIFLIAFFAFRFVMFFIVVDMFNWYCLLRSAKGGEYTVSMACRFVGAFRFVVLCSGLRCRRNSVPDFSRRRIRIARSVGRL